MGVVAQGGPLVRGGAEEVSRLILTASGGPFRELPAEQIAKATGLRISEVNKLKLKMQESK